MIEMAPFRVPFVRGLKITLMVQLAPAAMVGVQFVVLPNWPVIPPAVIFKTPKPVLVNVTCWGLLFVNTS